MSDSPTIVQQSLLNSLELLRSETDIHSLRRTVRSMAAGLTRRSSGRQQLVMPGKQNIPRSLLLSELDQIEQSQTLDRARYYISRLIKAITSVKTATINDLNLRQWKQYNTVLTDSLWLLPRRDSSGNHSAWYWGNFIPQIPHQLMVRYTRKGEWVLDPFAGSGTTLLEASRLGRNALGIELNPHVAARTREALTALPGSHQVRTELLVGDSVTMDFRKVLRKAGVSTVQLVILHPPYHDIIRFSNRRTDLSNASSVRKFANLFGNVVDNSLRVLDKGRFLAVVIGDKYSRREWIPLGFRLMEEVLKRKCLLKSIVVKNFEQTAGKRKQQALWRYRALVGGFYVFKHEYIFIFQKK